MQDTPTGYFDYYNAGRYRDGSSTGDLYLFTCFSPDRKSLGCHSVTGEIELRANIAALEGMGYINEGQRR